jgi:hypothetical protein
MNQIRSPIILTPVRSLPVPSRQSIPNGYSWFRGYAWQIQLCRNCFTQLGWKYMSQEDSFYGLGFKLLREEKPEKDNEVAS